MARKIIDTGLTDAQLLEMAETRFPKRIAQELRDTDGVNISERTIQRRLKKLRAKGHGAVTAKKAAKEDLRPIAGGSIVAPDKLRPWLDGNRFVFTSAQNNTYVHGGFYDALVNFCALRGAQLVVSPFTYNKSGFQNGTKDSDRIWYDPKIEQHFLQSSVQVAKDLVFCGELDILPTAENPLSGFASYTQCNSSIIPHAKVQMESVPRIKGQPARFMYTTGAVTQRNYIQRKAGQKAQFHHVFAALYVEVDEAGDWFARQLVASEDGSFYDLTEHFTQTGVTSGHRAAAITWGDVHREKMDFAVWDAAWGMHSNSMMYVLNPEVQFIHDLTDFTARNHHNIDDPFFLAAMHHSGAGNVENDLAMCGHFLDHIMRNGNPAVVVESNHDQALERWLKTADIRKDPENAEFFHRANAYVHKNIREGNPYHVFEWAVTRGGELAKGARFLKEDDSFEVHGVEQGMHGHRGPNGARGNPRGFRTVGRKVNIGHMHSAGIFGGVYVAGVSARLDMDYNKGPSSWSHSHIVTYQNGKRAIITMNNGKWRAV